MSAQYVVVTGSVGAGATTVATLIIDAWGADELLEEQIERSNPFFADAQSDPQRWMLASQAHFLTASARRHRRLRDMLASTTSPLIVEDRTPFEHHGAYTRAAHRLGYLSHREHQVLTDLADAIEPGYEIPALLVYREMTDEQLVDRVLGRGRAGESADQKRLRAYHEAFDQFAHEWERGPLVRVPADIDVLTADGKDEVIGMLTPYLGRPSA